MCSEQRMSGTHYDPLVTYSCQPPASLSIDPPASWPALHQTHCHDPHQLHQRWLPSSGLQWRARGHDKHAERSRHMTATVPATVNPVPYQHRPSLHHPGTPDNPSLYNPHSLSGRAWACSVLAPLTLSSSCISSPSPCLVFLLSIPPLQHADCHQDLITSINDIGEHDDEVLSPIRPCHHHQNDINPTHSLFYRCTDILSLPTTTRPSVSMQRNIILLIATEGADGIAWGSMEALLREELSGTNSLEFGLLIKLVLTLYVVFI